jgi:Domain of unknown function (DUF4928)
MTPRENALAAFRVWHDNLPRPRAAGGAPAKGSLAVGLVLLQRLKTTFDLDLGAHLAPGGAQIQGASGASVRAILGQFGEHRAFVSEGGRTNRGIPTIAAALLKALGSAGLDALASEEREGVLRDLQAILVDGVREFHNRERLKLVYNPSAATRQFIADLLGLANETGKHGPVAQYLVGADLQLRFPEAGVRNESCSAADDPSGQPGDFVVGDAIFHVTVAPMHGHYDKCLRNLQQGRRVYILVPDAVLVGTRQNVEVVAPGRIAVESIESFVSHDVEDLAGFARDRVAGVLRQLLETYNGRVDAVEIDKSIMVEIPRNLVERGVGN